MLRELNLP